MKNRKTIYIIINPVSGTSSKKGLPNKIAQILDSKKYNLLFYITGYAGHATEIAKQAVENKADYVIAVGGDGTVNEVARALINTDTVLGIMPLGSGNGLGRDLNISSNVKKAIDIIKEENVKIIDYGIANGHVFFCTCGVGFDAKVAHRVAGKKTRGTFMYFKSMLEAFFKESPENYEVITEEGTFKDKAFVVTCANATQYGYNAHIAPHADMQDGLMDLRIIKPLSLTQVPKISMQLFINEIDANKNMIGIQTKKVTIRRENEGAMHIDGDPLMMGKEINVEIVAAGLKVLVPSKVSQKHPLDPIELLATVFGGSDKKKKMSEK